MDFLEGLGTIHINTILIMVMRWVFVILALYILVQCIVSLVQSRNPSEVWAYLVNGETGIPVTHWENVIGRGKNCDIVIDDPTVSTNHGLLIRDTDGTWMFEDLCSRNGTYVSDKDTPDEFIKISTGSDKSPKIDLEYGDTIKMGMTDLTLVPISVEEKNNNLNMRKCDTRFMSKGPTFAALTLFQVLTFIELWAATGTEHLTQIFFAIFGLIAIEWIYFGIARVIGAKGYEIETIAFFLSTLNLACVAGSAPSALMKETIAIGLGVAGLIIICLILRDLEKAKVLRWILLVGASVLLIVNLGFGTVSFGAKNWLTIGGFSFQPSELVKVAYIWVGAATLDELFKKKSLWVFMGFSVFCLGCLGLMGDFGTAIIFFTTYLVISYLRSGDFSRLVLVCGVALAGGFLVLKFKPYIAQRFATWGHIWDDAVVNAGGYQQTRTLSAAASGGLVGVGAGNGWLHTVPAADTDMVFGMLIEEWGLIIAILAVLSILTLALFAVKLILAGRSTFYTILACGAMSMFVVQTMLNVFGCTDILPFTGVTFPFVSNGGTSMLVSWSLLAFVKGADTRENASFAVKGGTGI